MKKLLILALLSVTLLSACVQTTSPINAPNTPDQELEIDDKLTPELPEETAESDQDDSIVIPSPSETTAWTLVSGELPYADPDPIIYEGSVELSGWIVYKPVYVADPAPHFHVDKDSIKDLPTDLFGDEFYLGELPKGTLNELFKYDSSEPATILVDEFKVVMEGSPRLNMVGITSFSKNKIIPADSPDIFDNLTYLRKLQADAEDTCEDFYQIVEEGYNPFPIDMLRSENLHAKIEGIYQSKASADAFVQTLREIMISEGLVIPGALCVTDTHVYVTLSSDYSDLVIATWTDDGNFYLSEPITGLYDFAYTFSPELMGMQHLVRTGYGDAGNLWWQYDLVDVIGNKTERVEECAGNFIYVENALSDEMDVFKYSCELEYKP